jgi:primosomal protein N' (replication factor Y)
VGSARTRCAATVIAQCVITARTGALDQLFDYSVPDGMAVAVGDCVELPFGARVVEGYVIAVHTHPPTREDGEPVPLKDVARKVAGAQPLDKELVELAMFLRDRYLAPWGTAVAAVMPPVVRSRATVTYSLGEHPEQLPTELVQALARRPLRMSTLLKRPGVTRADLNRWLQSGALSSSTAREARRARTSSATSAELAQATAAEPLLTLNPDQSAALAAVTAALAAGRNEVFLLQGVTGSGKTEVYLRAIAQALAGGRSALVLVPEIALTAQMQRRFIARFGDLVAVLHSGLAQSEKRKQWIRIATGAATVVVGARSAIFAPVQRLGLVVVDEEHELSYKQDVAPRYLAREVAIWRAQRAVAPVILGSATPSLEAAYRAARGRYRHLILSQRVSQVELPAVQVIDMRAHLRSGGASVFSNPLRDAIAARLQRGEQTILFLNRRGFSPILLCRDCGESVACPHCDISLTLHRTPETVLVCHLCGHVEPVRDHCRACAGQRLRSFGAGTQRVEQELFDLFPQARTLRMDVDTTLGLGAHERILAEFEHGDADILLGTQMIAKGLDFANVTLVGVISADISLRVPDFRAAERTFDLLVQVAGRAGRREVRGEVVVQTFSPDHYAIRCAALQDYAAFYAVELAARRTLDYPPFTELTRFVITHGEQRVALEQAQALYADLCQSLQAVAGARVLPVVPAAILRLKGKYRYQCVVGYHSFAAVCTALQQVHERAQRRARAGVRIAADVNAFALS